MGRIYPKVKSSVELRQPSLQGCAKNCVSGTLKDTQAALRHASITTTGNVYVQVVEENVMRAVNSHASTVLEGWTPAVESMGLEGRNVKRLAEPMRRGGSASD